MRLNCHLVSMSAFSYNIITKPNWFYKLHIDDPIDGIVIFVTLFHYTYVL